jgi:hypothetical protein
MSTLFPLAAPTRTAAHPIISAKGMDTNILTAQTAGMNAHRTGTTLII